MNDLMRDVQAIRALGAEEIHGVAIIEGQPVRFAVIAVNQGEHGELVVELDRRTIRERKTR